MGRLGADGYYLVDAMVVLGLGRVDIALLFADLALQGVLVVGGGAVEGEEGVVGGGRRLEGGIAFGQGLVEEGMDGLLGFGGRGVGGELRGPSVHCVGVSEECLGGGTLGWV